VTSKNKSLKVKRNRSDLITIFAEKWLEYAWAVKDWVYTLLKRALSYQPGKYKYSTDEKVSQRIDKMFKGHHDIPQPNLKKLRAEAIKASHPILDLLFTSSELSAIPDIPECYDFGSGKFFKWSAEYHKIVMKMFDRIENAKNKLAFDEQKEQNEGVDEEPPAIAKKEEPDYLKYRYRGWDILTFLNEKAGHSSFYIQINGRQKQKIEYSPFLLLLFLAIKLKENKDGWVEIDAADDIDVTVLYSIRNAEDLIYRLRERMAPYLRTVNKEGFIEVEERNARLSTHPSRVQVPHRKWLKNTFEEVRDSLLKKREKKIGK